MNNQRINNVKTENGVLCFDVTSHNNNDLNSYAIDTSRISGIIEKDNLLIFAIQGAPKQIVTCTKECIQKVLNEFVKTDDDIIIIKGYSDYTLHTKKFAISMAVGKRTEKNEGLFICLDAFDQHSATTTFSQFIGMTIEEAQEIIQLIK